MDFEDLESSGLPIAFGSTKVIKSKAERNRRKKAQKKRSKQVKKDSRGDFGASSVVESFNYAEEFKVLEVLQDYRNPFTILWPKEERYKNESTEENQEDQYNEECQIESVNNVKEEIIISNDDPADLDKSVCPSQVVLHKYYQQRYDYFSLFDEGVQIDEEGWYSVTPEAIAKHIALEAKAIAETYRQNESDELVILDAFCGVGGNTIQFAKHFDRVVAVDLDANRLEMARHNAQIYSVADKITFIHADVFETIPELTKAKTYKFQVVFMSPPWGGPSYINQATFCPKFDLFSGRGSELFHLTRQLCERFILFMPRQTNIYRIAEMLHEEREDNELSNTSGNDSFVVEQHWLRNRIKAISIYFY